MNRQIGVCLGVAGTAAASLFFNAAGNRENSVFEYIQSWLNTPDAFPIDPNLPLGSGRNFHTKNGDQSAFPGAIADTEPDGWARRVINRDHATRRKEA
jgi:serine/threonine-protein kinase HipA